jgi:capsular exopolysaccharide synthesis family protein
MLANFDEIFLTREQAEEELGVPVLGLIPQIEEEGRRLVRDTHNFSPLMESYRALRTNLYFATLDRPVRTLLVTSTVPAEGKSTVLANLALSLAQENKKVIIVDSDLRRPSLHRLFETSVSPGLTDVLVGTHTVAAAIRETATPQVKLVPAGTPPPNPAELIGSAAMVAFLEEVGALCDIVLLDSPPAFYAESLLLAHRVEGVLLVIGEETLKPTVRRSMTALSRARANVVGTAFNHIKAEFGWYGYYGYYGGYVPSETPEGGPGDSAENQAGDGMDSVADDAGQGS